MTSIMPEGVAVRKAIQWISQMRKDSPMASLHMLIDQACIKFNLPPKECEFLTRFFNDSSPEKAKRD